MLDKGFLAIAEESYGLVAPEQTYTEVIAQAILAQAQALTRMAEAAERQAVALEKLAGCAQQGDMATFLNVFAATSAL